MPKRMKRPRMSGKKASRKMDVAYDNLLDLISLQLNEGDYAGAQRTCERLLASESLARRKRGAAYRYLGHALALAGDFAGRMRHTPTACSTCPNAPTCGSIAVKSAVNSAMWNRWLKILLRHAAWQMILIWLIWFRRGCNVMMANRPKRNPHNSIFCFCER